MFELITLPNTYYQQAGEKLYNLNGQAPLAHPTPDQFMANVGQLNQNLVNLPGLQNQAIYSIPPPHTHYISQLPPPQAQNNVQNLSSASILAALQATANNQAAGSSSSSSSSSTSSASNAQISTGSSSTSSTSSSNPFVNPSSINSSASSSPTANQQQSNLIPVNQQSQFGQLTYLGQQSQMGGSTQNLSMGSVNGDMEKNDPVRVILQLTVVNENIKL